MKITKFRLLYPSLFVVLLVFAATADAVPRLGDSCRAMVPVTSGAPGTTGVTVISSEIQLIHLPNGIDVQQLRGASALSHLQNLQSRRPAAFAASKKALAERGFRPTDLVFVERTIRRASKRTTPGSPYLLTQDYSEQNSDGEVVYWSWTDGNDATWEGSIYVEIYSDGAASTWDGQIDASTEEHPWVWYEKTWERRGREPIEIRAPRRNAPPRPYYLARSGPAADASPYLRVNRFYNWAKCHRANVVGGCAGAAVGCLFTGPGWAGCFGAACVGVQVGSAITCYMSN